MKRILIAEDEPRLAAFIEKGLTRNGYETATAKDGPEALKMAQEQTFSLVLLDLGLPLLDGMEVLKIIAATQQHLPVIIVSARTDESDINESILSGAVDYVTKPFYFKDLLQRISQLLT